jgi:hypothetical protein
MWNITRKYHTKFVYLIACGEFIEHDTFFKCIKSLGSAAISPSCSKAQSYEKEEMKNY